MSEKMIGIMGAMHEEISEVVQLLTEKQEHSKGMRTYFTGKLNGINTVIVFSRWGKVAAATTVSTLILEFGITELIFTGVAGAIQDQLQIGDIVVGKRFVQHDMDARPFINQYEVPLLSLTFFESREQEIDIATNAINHIIKNNQLYIVSDKEEIKALKINPRLYIGDIASGDKFFSSSDDKNKLLETLPSILCVEMEGAAVAQVCYEYGIPFTIVRTISDTAEEKSPVDFSLFIQHISSKYSAQIIKNIYNQFTP